MMTRVQVLLPDEQDRRLEALAARRRESKGKVIRCALDLLLRAESAEQEPLLDLIGQAGRSRRPDASDSHDLILALSKRSRNRRR
jgi:Arc/MetJ-type ribon-helix-helix transcriptional regulator